jgi:drug/metabolite transporter (DMT)-like permease
MERHSPLGVTALSMSMGTVLYVSAVSPELRHVDWAAVSGTTWLALVYSAVFALAVSYMIWYTGVQKLGGTRTSVYSNLVPLVALAVAVLWRGEPLGLRKALGAALVLAGVGLTRAAARTKTAPPQE